MRPHSLYSPRNASPSTPLFQILHEMDDYERKRSRASSSSSSASSDASTSPRANRVRRSEDYKREYANLGWGKTGMGAGEEKAQGGRSRSSTLDSAERDAHARAGRDAHAHGHVHVHREVEVLGSKIKGRLRAWTAAGKGVEREGERVKGYEGT